MRCRASVLPRCDPRAVSNTNPLGQLGSDTFLGDENWNHYSREVTLLGYKLSHDFNERWQVLQNARYMDASAYQRNTYNAALAADNRTLARNAYLTDEDSRGVVIDNQLAGKVQTGSAQHNLLLHLIKFPDAQSLRVVMDSQRIVSLEATRRLTNSNPELAARWQRRAETYGRLVHQTRDVGGLYGKGGLAAGQRLAVGGRQRGERQQQKGAQRAQGRRG